MKFENDLNDLSDRISTLVRTLALGVLAVAWLFLSKDKNAPPLSIVSHNLQLALIALLSIVALAFDLAQYQFGYWYARDLQEKAEKEGDTTVFYNKRHWKYKARNRLFKLKQCLVMLAALWLVVLIALAVFGW